jgi:SAM-dependent methyltransferase
MGIDLNTAKFLISTYEEGVRFDRALTLGKLTLFVDEQNLPNLQQELHRAAPEHSANLTALGDSESLFAALGAKQIDSMDKSDFEGATVLQDLNLPIPETLMEQYDLVCDGGTLEHIFNFPVAIKNAMELVKVGGHLVIQTPTNNWSGHGFYQFSPELYFRVLSEENGFRVKRMVVFEWGVNRWYEVVDPAVLQSRVYVMNARRTSLLILAERISRVPINQTPPQQSDYALAKWTAQNNAPLDATFVKSLSSEKTKARSLSFGWLKSMLSPGLLKLARAIFVGTMATKQALAPQSDYFSKHANMFKPVER